MHVRTYVLKIFCQWTINNNEDYTNKNVQQTSNIISCSSDENSVTIHYKDFLTYDTYIPDEQTNTHTHTNDRGIPSSYQATNDLKYTHSLDLSECVVEAFP